jgi:DNA repair protein RecN (Recombination protein N)
MEDLEVEFKPGLNVLTGETGAGKSIVVEAISVLLGERTSAQKVRSGCDRAVIEGLFELDASDPDIAERFEEMGINVIDGDLILRRDIFASGTGRCYINGRMTSSSCLTEIGEYLCDIHGQHQHQTLLRSARQLDLLDAFSNAIEVRGEVGGLFRELRDTEKALKGILQGRENRDRRIGDLKYTLEEIERANLEPGEDDRLSRDIQVARHYEQLNAIFGKVLERIYREEGSVIEALGISLKELDEAIQIDSSLSEVVEEIKTCYFQLEDLMARLMEYRDKLVYDPDHLEELLDRRELIRKLKSKYGDTIQSVLKCHQETLEELTSLEAGGNRAEELEMELKRLAGELHRKAEMLTELRVAGSRELERQVMTGLKELGMQKALERKEYRS